MIASTEEEEGTGTLPKEMLSSKGWSEAVRATSVEALLTEEGSSGTCGAA
jgi:hypothetical protein